MITIGSDEAGWGPVAGPLYVVAVAMPKTWRLQGLRDSKKLSRVAREALFEPLIEEVRGHWALAVRTPGQLDNLSPQRCLVDAHTSVLTQLIETHQDVDRVIVDGSLRLPLVPRAVAVPKAEDAFQVVAAASVIAKVLHDDAMLAYAETYPQYGFERHVGYGTKDHYKAIRKYGLCALHRRSYLKKLIEQQPKGKSA